MSKRCFATHRSGLTNLNGRLYSGASAVGSAVLAAELGSTGGYYSDFPDADFSNADHCRFTTVTWPDEVAFDFGVQNRNEVNALSDSITAIASELSKVPRQGKTATHRNTDTDEEANVIIDLVA